MKRIYTKIDLALAFLAPLIAYALAYYSTTTAGDPLFYLRIFFYGLLPVVLFGRLTNLYTHGDDQRYVALIGLAATSLLVTAAFFIKQPVLALAGFGLVLTIVILAAVAYRRHRP